MLAKRIIPCLDVRNGKVVKGVNFEGIAVGGKCGITTSGGVHDMEDMRVCNKMGLYGAICGKSIYSGSLDLAEAVRYANCGD